MPLSRLRLGIFSDNYSENTFICKTSDCVFARIDKIKKVWCVWYYKSHTQKNYKALKEALEDINSHFFNYYFK